MTKPAEPRRPHEPLAWSIIACPHCLGQARFKRSRWAPPEWTLYSDMKRVPVGRGETSLVTLCPHCHKCYWREEAELIGYANDSHQWQGMRLMECDTIPHVGTPSAADLEAAILEGLPRLSSQVWDLHLMAWHRLNDGLRLEPMTQRSHPNLDLPIRHFVAKSLLAAMPNRQPLTRLLRVDILRQTGQFAKARKLNDSLNKIPKQPKSLTEWEATERISIYAIFMGAQKAMIYLEDRLPRAIPLLESFNNNFYHLSQEAMKHTGAVEQLSTPVNRDERLWKRIESQGWACHHCGRGGRAGTDFHYRDKVICRHCGWTQ